MMKCGRFKEHMMAYLDGELDQDGLREFESHLVQCADCRRELDEMTRLTTLVGRIELPKPSKEDMMKYWPSVYARIERGAGWGLLMAGAVVWICYGIYLFVTDPSIEALTKFLIALPVVGVILLLISVARERCCVGKTERYKEIER
jgi:hypothetical protein